jgi:16S rRNA (adenine1518-N6/adenine1519-N6)-dimethyltransferase
VKLTELQTTLKDLGASPTKSLGQNFLHDRNLAEWIVAQLELQPGERWLEIGPGLGALTSIAQHYSTNGLLIEKDDRLIGFLQNRYPNLEVFHGDACRFDTRNLLPGGPIKILGNLPYYVSSQIIFNFTGEAAPSTLLLFTLQKELAERFAATENSKNYGGPTVLIGRRWKVEILRTLPGSVFLPAPNVDSSVVRFTPRHPEEFPACDNARFSSLVKLGFSQRRKQLGKLLAPMLPQWAEAAASINAPVTARAESLSIRQWCELAAWTPTQSLLTTQQRAQDIHGEIFDVVDENDRIVGSASRHHVHTQRLIHRAVHVFVFNEAGELFLQKRSRWKDVCPLKWDSSAAGHVNSGHDYPETASRELEEELGITAEVKFNAKISPCEETGHEFVALFEAGHQGPFQLPPAEVERGEWFTLSQIEEWTSRRPADFAPGFLKCWSVWRAISR